MAATSLAVVISTYNNPAFLRLVLEGYRRQSCHDFTIYIADDGSGEETRQLILNIQESFPVQIRHFWQADEGFRKARIHNRVFAEITEPQVLLTDGDCIPLPDLVAAHLEHAGADYFINGSRVLISQAWTETLCRGTEALDTGKPPFWWLIQRLRGRINRCLPFWLPATLSQASIRLAGIRGCHLACPTAALLRINGFDEAFEGWGREDSDLTARLLHAGYMRRNLRGVPVLHLWHQEFSRDQLGDNDERLQACLNEQRIEAERGIKQL